MCIVATFIRSSMSVILAFCFCILSALSVSAESPRESSNTSKLIKSSRPITKGWEPVNEITPITHGWQTVAKSDVLQKKLNQLTDKDYDAALHAVHFALSEIEDGKIYHWKRDRNNLRGKVMPINAFKDKEGRLCRHIIYTLALEKYRKTVEGVACRSINGGWSLSG